MSDKITKISTGCSSQLVRIGSDLDIHVTKPDGTPYFTIHVTDPARFFTGEEMTSSVLETGNKL